MCFSDNLHIETPSYLHLTVTAVIERRPRGRTLDLTLLPHDRHALRREPLNLLRCHRHAHTRLRRLQEHLGTAGAGK